MSGPTGLCLSEGAGKPATRSRACGLMPEATCRKRRLGTKKQLLEQRALCRPGGYGGAAAPDPIPNSAVKRSSADGTSSQDAGE